MACGRRGRRTWIDLIEAHLAKGAGTRELTGEGDASRERSFVFGGLEVVEADRVRVRVRVRSI